MVNINIYENAAGQAENAGQGTVAPVPQSTGSAIQESQSAAPSPGNMTVSSQTSGDSAPAPAFFNGVPLTAAEPSFSGRNNQKGSDNSFAPSPARQFDTAASNQPAPVPSSQITEAGNSQTSVPVPNSEPGEEREEKKYEGRKEPGKKK